MLMKILSFHSISVLVSIPILGFIPILFLLSLFTAPCLYCMYRRIAEEQMKLDNMLFKLSSLCRILNALTNVRNRDLRSKVCVCVFVCVC